jgi:hypothetical protein
LPSQVIVASVGRARTAPETTQGVIAPFPNLTSLDVDTHKGLSLTHIPHPFV